MSETSCNCGCGSSCSTGCVTNEAPSSVYACAGASNVGVISYDLAIALHKANRYKLGCSTCVGAGDCGCGEVTDEDQVPDLLIDGCAVGCLKKMFDKQAKTNYKHIIVTQLGVKKEGRFDYAEDLLDRLMDKLTEKGI